MTDNLLISSLFLRHTLQCTLALLIRSPDFTVIWARKRYLFEQSILGRNVRSTLHKSIKMEMKMATKKLYSIPETSRRLGDIGRSKVYELVNSKRLKLVKLGRRSAITEESVDAVIAGAIAEAEALESARS